MSGFIKIKNGLYRNIAVKNTVFPLIKEFQFSGNKNAPIGSGFVTVDGTGVDGFPSQKIRVKVSKANAVVITDKNGKKIVSIEKSIAKETDKQIISRMDSRFKLMRKMTRGAKDGCIRSLIITGAPGVGKSYGVFEELENSSLFEMLGAGSKFEDDGTRFDSVNVDPDRDPNIKPIGKRYDIVKGVVSTIGLYAKLWEYRHAGDVVVFDDCDDALDEPECLNLLKAALDSGKKRTLQYHKDSKFLQKLKIDNKFDFEGSVIFITNIDMHGESKKETGSTKKRAHMRALMSRSHYLDLSLSTEREKVLRIKSVYESGDLFKKYEFTKKQEQEIIDYLIKNKGRVRELSLRMAVNIADLVAMDDENNPTWKQDAEILCIV